MFPNHFSFLAFFTGLALSILPCAAQTSTKVSVQFLAFPKNASFEPIELAIGKNKTISIEIPGNELSPIYSIPTLDSIQVGKTTTNDEGEPVFEVYGTGKPKAAAHQIVLLIRKGKQNSDGFAVLPINGEPKNFPGGSFLFINVSKIGVAGVVGEGKDSKFSLKPGQRKMLKPKANHKDGICQVTLAYQRDEKWKKFYDTRWPANKDCRSLIFFYQNPETGRLGIAPIMDILPN